MSKDHAPNGSIFCRFEKSITNIFNKIASKDRYIVAMVFIIVLALSVPYYSSHSATSQDESTYIYAAKEVKDGEILYKDVFYAKPPGMVYLFVFVFTVFGESITYIRILTAIFNALTAVSIFYLGKDLYSKKSGFLGSLLFAFAIINPYSWAYWGRQNTYMMFFMVLSLVLISKGIRKSHSIYFFLAGICTALAILMKQPGALALFLAIFYIFLFEDEKQLKKLKQSFIVVIGATLPLIVTALYFIYNDAYDAMIEWTLTFWTNNVPQPSPTRSIKRQLEYHTNFQPYFSYMLIIVLALFLKSGYQIINTFHTFQPSTPSQIGKKRTIHLIFKSIMMFISSNKSDSLMIFWILLLTLFILRSPVVTGGELIMFFPPICLYGGKLLKKILSIISSKKDAPAEVSYLKKLAVIVLMFFVLSSNYYYRDAIAYHNIDEISFDVSRYIKENTNSTDTIYVFGYLPDVYVWSDRDSASEFSGLDRVLWTHKIAAELEDIILDDLKDNNPKYIITIDKQVPEHYDKITDFVSSRYHIEKIFEIADYDRYYPDNNVIVWRSNNGSSP